MNYSTCNGPVPQELKCCDTESVREVCMAEDLDKTRDNLLDAIAVLEYLDAYIFAVKPTESVATPNPECMRDAIYSNAYLAEVVITRLKKLTDRICQREIGG